MTKGHRAGVIGHTGRGNYGHGLDTAWRHIEGVEVVALADPDPVGRAAAQARSGAQRTYSDYREMLERERLDLVSVGPRWPDQHEAMVLAAIGAGARGIFCEKPFARTPEEADHMLREATRTGAKIALCLQHRPMKVLREMRDIIRSGELGDIREVRGRPSIGPRTGAHLFMVLGTHIVDLMRYVLDTDPEWVFSRLTSRAGHEITAEDAQEGPEELGLLAGDAVAAMYGFPNGVTGYCDTFTTPTILNGGMSLEVWGTEGIVAMRQGTDPETATRRYLYRWDTRSGLPVQELRHVPIAGWDDDLEESGDARSMNRHIVRDLLAAIDEDRPPMASGDDGRWALEMIWGAHYSQLTGGRVQLPLPHGQRGNPYAVSNR